MVRHIRSSVLWVMDMKLRKLIAVLLCTMLILAFLVSCDDFKKKGDGNDGGDNGDGGTVEDGGNTEGGGETEGDGTEEGGETEGGDETEEGEKSPEIHFPMVPF